MERSRSSTLASSTFEFDDTTPKAKIWTLLGNDTKIMYSTVETKLTGDGYRNQLIAAFGSEKCSDIKNEQSLKLGDVTLTGSSFIVTFAQPNANRGLRSCIR